MDKKDFSDIEDQIMSTVSNALKAIDFANLKKDINDKTDHTLNQFKTKFNEYSEKYMSLNKKSKKDISAYISKRPVGSISGILYILFGMVGIFTYGSSLLAFLIFKGLINGSFAYGSSALTFLMFNKFMLNKIISNIAISGSYFAIRISLVLFVVSVGLLIRGIILRKRVSRFKRYVRFIDNNSYFLIEELAKFYNQKKSFVVKELSKMIKLGMFLEGHIDEEKKYFILNDELYNEYLNLKKQQIEDANSKEKLNEEISNIENEDIKSTIKIGRNYIEQINTVKNDLYKEEIAKKLDKLGNITNQIINYVEKNPKKIQEVNKFINHYLPITIKLINSYKELNNQLVQGDNIKNAKGEIEKSIDLINNAFENLLDDLFEDVVLDISTDISVLKTLFKQEGLTEEDFKK